MLGGGDLAGVGERLPDGWGVELGDEVAQLRDGAEHRADIFEQRFSLVLRRDRAGALDALPSIVAVEPRAGISQIAERCESMRDEAEQISDLLVRRDGTGSIGVRPGIARCGGAAEGLVVEVDELAEVAAHVIEPFADELCQGVAVQPDGQGFAALHGEQCALRVVRGELPRLDGVMQRFGHEIEFAAGAGKLVVGGFCLKLPRRARSFDGIGKLLGDAAAVAGAAMQIEDEVAEPDGREALGNGVDGGALFSDEEDGLAGCGEFGDEVGDGLALAGAGRADHDEVVAGEGSPDDGTLGGVGIED